MPFCSKCGNYESEGTSHCSKCGQNMVGHNDAANQAREKFEQFTDTPDSTSQYTQEEMEANKGMCVLAYLGILMFIPLLVQLFGNKKSDYVRFHTNQGLVLFLIMTVWDAVAGILSRVLWLFGWVVELADVAVAIIGLVFTIIGIINAAKCRARELPLIGGIRILK